MTTRETHKKQRQRLRKKLIALGMPPEKVDRVIVEKRERQLRERGEQRDAVVKLAALQDETYRRLQPDDRAFRPAPTDSVLTGSGRATGAAARAVRRRRAMTKWEYDELEGRR